MKAGKVLIADDNNSVLSALNILLRDDFEMVQTVNDPSRLPALLQKNEFNIVLLDMNFRSGFNTGEEGLFWLKKIKSEFPAIEVVMLTAYGDVELAVNALKEGAADFILKPWDNEKLMATLRSALRLHISNVRINELREKESALKHEIRKSSTLIYGRSPAMKRVMEMVRKVAPSDANILITGENGTGKELIAGEIHRLSGRNRELMVTVDLGSLSETLFESELFGHKKGSFTHAVDDRTGKFVLADKGTLFLDEIGNLPLHLQSKLLTVLQNRLVIPVGSNREIPIDVRLVAATNKNPEGMVSENLFRQDLLYRINTIRIDVPPLRERKDDIELLAGFFLDVYSRKYGKPVAGFDGKAMTALIDYGWPGNVRELQHTVEKAVILCEAGSITSGDLQLSVGSFTLPISAATLEEMEKIMIVNALKKNPGSMNTAATELGITRQTLYNKIKKYGL